MSKEINTSHRPEARPFSCEELDASQKDAFDKIRQSILAAQQDLKDRSHSDRNELQSSLDHQRVSRLVFLSGRRGSGKTSLLLSLQKYFFQDASDDERAFKSKTIWLETLDMEPMASSPNLLASILVRIENAITRQYQVTQPQNSFDTYDSPYELNEAEHDPLTALRKLQRDVALVWEGNLRERSEHLDPDDFAIEVLRAERCRLGLNSRLGRLLELLARILQQRGVCNPLFLLPIDDFDIEPLRSLELLHLLRLISQPRLFTIICGDIEIAEKTLNLKTAGDLLLTAQRPALSDFLSLPSRELGAIAGNIGANALRKLIPPAQRIQLGPMDFERAMAYSPQSEKPKTLKNLLEELKIGINSAYIAPNGKQLMAGRNIENIERFLLLEEPANTRWYENTDNSKESNKDKPFYPGTALFHAAPRQISDMWFGLWQTIDEIEQEKKQAKENNVPEVINEINRRATIEFFVRRFQDAVREDANLSPEEKAPIIEAVRRDYQGQWELNTNAIKIATDLGPEVYFDLKVPKKGYCTGQRCRVVIADLKDWDINPRHSNKKDSDRQFTPRFSDPATASLFIIHDLLALRRPLGIIGHGLTPDPFKTVWAGAFWSVGPASRVRVPWVTPYWSSFWEFSLFRNAWNAIWRMARETDSDGPADHTYTLLYRWIKIIADILSQKDCKNSRVTPRGRNLEQPTLDDYYNLCLEIKVLLEESRSPCGGRRRRRLLIDHFLCHIVCALSPESGVITAQSRLWAITGESNLNSCTGGQSGSSATRNSASELEKELDRKKRLVRLMIRKLYHHCWQNFPLQNHVKTIRAVHAARFWDEGARRETYEMIISEDSLRQKIVRDIYLLRHEHGDSFSILLSKEYREPVITKTEPRSLEDNVESIDHMKISGESILNDIIFDIKNGVASGTDEPLRGNSFERRFEALRNTVADLVQSNRRVRRYEKGEGAILERIDSLRMIETKKNCINRRVYPLYTNNPTYGFCPTLKEVGRVRQLIAQGKPFVVKLGGFIFTN